MLEPSTVDADIEDGSILQDRTFHVNASYHGWFSIQARTFHTLGLNRGQFDVNKANLPRLRHISRMVRDPGVEPSMLRLNIVDGSTLQGRTFHVNASYHGWFSIQTRTIHALGLNHGQFRDLTTLFIRITATTDRQAGLTQSPAQPCRIVAAGDALEATEKLYERHYLVIKIVSSFFCLSDKVFVSLSIDLQ